MKKLMFLMVALLVVPAMAAVEITLVEVEGECAVDIVITATGDDAVDGKSKVAGIALKVSVEPGEEITSISNYMTTGVSVAGAAGYGIYMGNITFEVLDPGGPNEETVIDETNSPVAPADAMDLPPQLPGESCVLEFGGLFDVAEAGDAPLAVTTLARINLAGDSTVTVEEEIPTRGGIVNIGGTLPSSTPIMPAPTLVTCVTACVYTGPAALQAEWVAVGSPSSWCGEYQCHGDADGLMGVVGRNAVRVDQADIDILLLGYNEPYPGTGLEPGPAPTDPDTTHPWIAADFNHVEGTVGRNQRRVDNDDVDILVYYYNDGRPVDPIRPPLGDCQTATPTVP